MKPSSSSLPSDSQSRRGWFGGPKSGGWFNQDADVHFGDREQFDLVQENRGHGAGRFWVVVTRGHSARATAKLAKASPAYKKALKKANDKNRRQSMKEARARGDKAKGERQDRGGGWFW